ncbi:hypothetical protein BU16DRAFT_554093 [Lophium mytilinum]|uniref:Uncharacterized protein n=1 Tax=Lophium mytilinum TaxID=390894 RepID=A0A6A6RE67_9PEZI|nr:hypothetical protein BU16DRAFT_554093 [Lophium mytilinum]
MVLARWIHGDHGFYKAKITMVMGSASASKLRVKFPTPTMNDADEGRKLGDPRPESEVTVKDLLVLASWLRLQR